jgi:predicted anti-sigma-YlaC factor YlaD
MSRDPLLCQEFVEAVTDYLEGVLPRRERRRIDAHLRACHGCSAYLEQMRVTIRTLGALPPEPPDPHTREALLRAFREVRGVA